MLRTHLLSSGKGDIKLLPLIDYTCSVPCIPLSLYKRAHLVDPLLPVPTKFGRKHLDGNLLPIMMEKASNPLSIKNICCKCF